MSTPRHRFARSAAVASSALLIVVGASFAHDTAFSDAPAGGASVPTTWVEDDDRQATEFLVPAPEVDENEQADDNEQGDENGQGEEHQTTPHAVVAKKDHVAAKPAKHTAAGDDDQGEDTDEDDHDGADAHDGEHEQGDDHDGGHDGNGGDD